MSHTDFVKWAGHLDPDDVLRFTDVPAVLEHLGFAVHAWVGGGPGQDLSVGIVSIPDGEFMAVNASVRHRGGYRWSWDDAGMRNPILRHVLTTPLGRARSLRDLSLRLGETIPPMGAPASWHGGAALAILLTMLTEDERSECAEVLAVEHPQITTDLDAYRQWMLARFVRSDDSPSQSGSVPGAA